MARLAKKTSSGIAKERLKLVLIHDRAGTSPSSNLIEMLKKDIIAVLTRYFEIYEEDFDVEIKRSTDSHLGSHETRLTANIPIRSIKNIGRNVY